MLKLLTVWITSNCWKFLNRWEHQTTLPASCETCMHVKKQQLEPDMEQRTDSRLGREYFKVVSPCWFNFYSEYIMQNARLDEAQAGIKIARYVDDTALRVESEEELKSLLMKVKEKSKKAGLKVNLQKTKIMASGPISWWQIDGLRMETVTDFIYSGCKITADGNCSHEIKRPFLLGRKAMTNLDSILKSGDIALPTKACIVKAVVFSVVMYGCESWTMRKAKCWRIGAFKL